ncbi:hypothetical protein GCM10010923_14770 [Blastomonas marina]|uniref:Transmembrane protein n=1 Tax=Blastomonas marina TaxID=1867408 RepID=A0ABQ1FCG7_9SPHN|nr:hypothetical protein [Blastomonas marina]GGA05979.1 hypothetical protein GCM10010923_14770 [Blastomonas marina]
MKAPDRIGLAGKTRGRLYLGFGWLVFLSVFFGMPLGAAVAIILALVIWQFFFDPVDVRGERRFLGWKSEKSKPFVGSIVGKKINEE